MYTNPSKIIKECEQQIRKSKADLEKYKWQQWVIELTEQEIIRLENIKAVAEKQLIEQQGLFALLLCLIKNQKTFVKCIDLYKIHKYNVNIIT